MNIVDKNKNDNINCHKISLRSLENVDFNVKINKIIKYEFFNACINVNMVESATGIINLPYNKDVIKYTLDYLNIKKYVKYNNQNKTNNNDENNNQNKINKDDENKDEDECITSSFLVNVYSLIRYCFYLTGDNVYLDNLVEDMLWRYNISDFNNVIQILFAYRELKLQPFVNKTFNLISKGVIPYIEDSTFDILINMIQLFEQKNSKKLFNNQIIVIALLGSYQRLNKNLFNKIKLSMKFNVTTPKELKLLNKYFTKNEIYANFNDRNSYPLTNFMKLENDGLQYSNIDQILNTNCEWVIGTAKKESNFLIRGYHFYYNYIPINTNNDTKDINDDTNNNCVIRLYNVPINKGVLDLSKYDIESALNKISAKLFTKLNMILNYNLKPFRFPYSDSKLQNIDKWFLKSVDINLRFVYIHSDFRYGIQSEYHYDHRGYLYTCDKYIINTTFEFSNYTLYPYCYEISQQ